MSIYTKLLNYLLTASVLCYIATLPACKKAEPEYHYVSKELKEYFNWKKGTYWVFYDSVARKVDSISVTDYSVNSPQNTGNRGNENIGIKMDGYYRGAGHDTSEWYVSLSSSNSTFLLISKIFNSINFNTFTYNIPFFIWNYYASTDDYYPKAISTFYTSLNIGGNTYYDVYKLHFTYRNSNHYDTFYINKDCGFIAVFLNDEFYKRRLYLLNFHKEQ